MHEQVWFMRVRHVIWKTITQRQISTTNLPVLQIFIPIFFITILSLSLFYFFYFSSITTSPSIFIISSNVFIRVCSIIFSISPFLHKSLLFIASFITPILSSCRHGHVNSQLSIHFQ